MVSGLTSRRDPAGIRPSSEGTRARIAEVAETLFRRIGFAKTTVADIAAELGMSPANVYRFFPSKDAIVEAICRRCLGEIEAASWAVAHSRGSAAGRLERLVLEIFSYNRRNLLSDQRVHDIVLAAIERNWETAVAYRKAERAVAEFIIRDGIEAGEFEPVDPSEAARFLMRGMLAFIHPVMIAHGLADEPDGEAAARAQIRFLLRGIARKG